MPEGGVLAAMVTPFGPHGELWLDPLPDYLAFLKQGGLSGVVVAGTNGEGTSLSVDECKRLLEAVLRSAHGLRVIASTGAASLTDALDLTRHAGALGVEATLALPPFFFKQPPDQGVASYFRQLLDASDVPLLLYNIPQFSGVDVAHAVLEAVRDHPRLGGIKDSTGDWPTTGALLASAKGLAVYPGNDALLFRARQAGASGAISGTANALPELVSAVFKAATDAEAEKAQQRLDAVREVLGARPLIAANKAILAARGLPFMRVRPPLCDMTTTEAADLTRTLAALGAWSA